MSIIQATLQVAPVPVFVGVGGGRTTGNRSIAIALQAELLGAYGVVVNAPMDNKVIEEMNSIIDIPIIATVVTNKDDFKGKLKAGASILNISGGANTAKIVKQVRDEYGEELPIIATGGQLMKPFLKQFMQVLMPLHTHHQHLQIYLQRSWKSIEAIYNAHHLLNDKRNPFLLSFFIVLIKSTR